MKRVKSLVAIMLSFSVILAFALLVTGCDGLTGPESTVGKTYYVTLYNRGSASNPAQFKDGETYTLPTPTRKWYTFKAWNTAADGSGTSHKAGDPITVSSKIVLYGQWSLAESNVMMPASSYDVFCNDRNSLDSTADITIRIGDSLPDADDLSASSYKLNITLDLSACSGLKNLDDTYSFKNVVGIVFPSKIESIFAGAFNNGYCDNLASVTFIATANPWYRYASGSWDTSTNKPVGPFVDLTGVSVTDPAANAAKFLKSSYYWSSTQYSPE